MSILNFRFSSAFCVIMCVINSSAYAQNLTFKREWIQCIKDNLSEYLRENTNPLVIVAPACPTVDVGQALSELTENTIVPDGFDYSADNKLDAILEVDVDDLQCVLNKLFETKSDLIIINESNPCAAKQN